MPLLFLAALAGSLALHVVALFGTDIELSGPAEPAPLTLTAELKALPAPALETPAALPAKVARKPKARPIVPLQDSAPPPLVAAGETGTPATSTAEAPEVPTELPSPVLSPPPAPALPGKGVIRFAVIKSSLGLLIGRAEQRWEFAEDGSYRLSGLIETTGLAAWLKPARVEQESRGRLVAGGLQPAHFSTLKNGRDASESAEFDWSTAEVRLARDASVHPIARGTQDALSFIYQLAYLGRLDEGITLGVVTGRKYDRYALDSLGEEEIEVPAGYFRTLHLRAQTDSSMEIWIALEQRGLPVKIRFTDKKGESFEQVATEIGM